MNLSIDQIAAICVIGTTGLTVGGWFVTMVVRKVIKEDFEKMLSKIQGKVSSLENRMLRVEIHTGLDRSKGGLNANTD